MGVIVITNIPKFGVFIYFFNKRLKLLLANLKHTKSDP